MTIGRTRKPGHRCLSAGLALAVMSLTFVLAPVAAAPAASAGTTINAIVDTGESQNGYGPCGQDGSGYYATGTDQSDSCGTDGGQSHAWCADFSAWVWQQAGVQDMSTDLNNLADSFVSYGQANGTVDMTDGDQAQVGDAIVYVQPGDSNPADDHVVIDVDNTSSSEDTTVGGNEGGGNGLVQEDQDAPNVVGVSAGVYADSGDIVYAVVAPVVGATTTTPSGPLGDLLQFSRASGGSWGQLDITSHAGLNRASAITLPFSDSPLGSPGPAATAAAPQPVQTTDSSGDISVMAVNGSSQLVQFNRKGNDWGEFNITASNGGQDHATAVSEPFQDGSNLSEIAINGNGNLDQFNRGTNNKWTTFNITKSNSPQLDDVTAIDDPFIDGSELSVLAINTSSQLVEFNRASGGSWSEANITTSNGGLAKASAITDPFIDGSNLSVMAIDASGQLVQFNRPATGGLWTYFNITQTKSLDKVSAITEPFEDGSNLSVMAINTSGQLVQFNRSGSTWGEVA
jgi:hypothetical protein